MTSVLGALWTGLQSLGWLLYFLRQLIADMLNINYRLVNGVVHLITGLAKLICTMSSSVSLAVYEIVSSVLLKVAGIFTFVIDCLYFLIHCCTLLFKIIYFTVSGVADGLFFVLLMPICACQTVHSWITWMFNTEHWLNVAAYCLQKFSVAFSLVGETTLQLVLSSLITVNCWLSSVAAFTYEHMITVSSAIYDGLLSLCAGLIGGITYVPFQIWCFTVLQLDLVYTYVLGTLVNCVYNLWQLCTTNYLCFIPVSLPVVMLLFFSGTRLSRRYFRPSAGEVIHIHLNDADDVIEVSDDEQDDFRGNAANRFPFIGGRDGYLMNMAAESSDEESDIITVDESSDDSDVISDSDSIDSDQEAIDVQLPAQSTTPPSSSRQHGYATRSKANTDHVQLHQEQERERSLCVICRDQVKSVLVLPCRHMCMCVDCARTVVSGSHDERRICPLCRGNIRIVMNVYT